MDLEKLVYGVSYFVYIISFRRMESLLPTLPVRIVIAIIVYCLIVLRYAESNDDNDHKTVEHENNEEATSTLPEKNEEKAIETIERIVVKNGQRIDVILIPEIICITAEGDYVMIQYRKRQIPERADDEVSRNNIAFR